MVFFQLVHFDIQQNADITLLKGTSNRQEELLIIGKFLCQSLIEVQQEISCLVERF